MLKGCKYTLQAACALMASWMLRRGPLMKTIISCSHNPLNPHEPSTVKFVQFSSLHVSIILNFAKFM